MGAHIDGVCSIIPHCCIMPQLERGRVYMQEPCQPSTKRMLRKGNMLILIGIVKIEGMGHKNCKHASKGAWLGHQTSIKYGASGVRYWSRRIDELTYRTLSEPRSVCKACAVLLYARSMPPASIRQTPRRHVFGSHFPFAPPKQNEPDQWLI